MAIPKEHKWRYFFHFTHVENLDSIIKNGLLCTNAKNAKSIEHVNVASESIQARRSDMKVTCGLKGSIHDYVPFYFTCVSPMFLSVINSKNQDQQLMIFLCMSIDKIEGENVVFTDASANTNTPPHFYDKSEELVNLDWKDIDSRKWRFSDEDRHKKMAEVLVPSSVAISEIDAIVVWNKDIKDSVIKIFKDNNITPPQILFSGGLVGNKYYFYFSKFGFPGRDGETLVTGPKFLKNKFEKLIQDVNDSRKVKRAKYRFNDIGDALNKIDANFCILKELNDIFTLKTDNTIHTGTVGEHTKEVVDELMGSHEYNVFDDNDKKILKLSAYLHDIGKGPKSKWGWNKGIQRAYPDHPADAIPMLKRILVEEFENISKAEIRKICMLVVYHDLVGDIIGRGRDTQQIIDIINGENELELLIALSLADVSCLKESWVAKIRRELPDFRKRVLREKK